MRKDWHIVNNRKTAAWNSLETVPRPNRGDFHSDQWENSCEITWYFGGFFPEEVWGDGGEVILAQEEGAEGWPEGQVVAVAQLCNLVTGQDKNRFYQVATTKNSEKLRYHIKCRIFWSHFGKFLEDDKLLPRPLQIMEEHGRVLLHNGDFATVT